MRRREKLNEYLPGLFFTDDDKNLLKFKPCSWAGAFLFGRMEFVLYNKFYD